MEPFISPPSIMRSPRRPEPDVGCRERVESHDPVRRWVNTTSGCKRPPPTHTLPLHLSNPPDRAATVEAKSKGHQVVCVDVDEAKVAAVNSTASPVFERGLNELPRGTPEGDSAPPVTYPAP